MKNTSFTRWITAVFASALALTAASGCALMPDSSDEKASTTEELMSSAYPFTDLPVHSSFTLDRSKSFIYESGSGSLKVGRLYYSAWNKAQEVVDYYQSVMASHGWKLINAMEHDGVILNYEKEGWVCTLIIKEYLFKTYIEVQIGPK